MHNVADRSKKPPPIPQQQSLKFTEDTQIDLRSLLGVLRRHRWLILITVVCVVATAVLVTFQLREQFTAKTLVVVDSRDARVLGFESGFVGDSIGFVDTEVEIARSAKVIERTAAALDIGNWPNFAEKSSVFEMLKALVGIVDKSEQPSSKPGLFTGLPDSTRARLVEELTDRVSVRRIGLTSVITMSATAFDPVTSARMANTLAEAYLTEQIAAKIGTNERSATFLMARIDALAGEIIAFETQIDNFVTEKLTELGSPAARELLIRLSRETQTRQLDAEALAEIQAALRLSDFDRLARLTSLQPDLIARRAALSEQIADLSDEARLSDVKERLDALDAEIRTAATNRTDALRVNIALSEARSLEARRQISDMLDQVDLPQDISVELFRLQRNAETSRSFYQSYLTKLKQIEQKTEFDVPDSRIIAAATPPSKPSYPPRRLIIGGSILFALGLGIGLAFLRENFIGGINSIEQMENVSGLPVIASVPHHTGNQSAERPESAIISQPLSAYSEAIRRIRLGVELYSPSAKCVFVTSALPSDGKTTIAMSVARHMALIGKSTLLIDADLRHPAVHKFLGEKVEKGLITFLSDGSRATPENLAIVKEPETGASFVLGAEASSIATDALLMSDRFEALMSFARDNYDVIIVDTPPVGLVVDATIVARHCDMGLFVVRYASTGQNAVRGSLRDLAGRTDTPIFCVLNNVDKADSDQYGYSRKYRNYYR